MPGTRSTCWVLLAGCLLLSACGGDDETEPANGEQGPEEAAAACEPAQAPAPKDVAFSEPEQVIQEGERAAVTFETNCGEFTVELATGEAPEAANSLAFLADQGFYDDMLVFRIEPGFVFQTGSPQQQAVGDAGYQTNDPPSETTVYSEGVVAMAKTEVEPAGTGGSQFFVVTGPQAGTLPAEYAVAGEVIAGRDVVQRIDELGSPGGQPTETVVVERAVLQRAGGR